MIIFKKIRKDKKNLEFFSYFQFRAIWAHCDIHTIVFIHSIQILNLIHEKLLNHILECIEIFSRFIYEWIFYIVFHASSSPKPKTHKKVKRDETCISCVATNQKHQLGKLKYFNHKICINSMNLHVFH